MMISEGIKATASARKLSSVAALYRTSGSHSPKAATNWAVVCPPCCEVYCADQRALSTAVVLSLLAGADPIKIAQEQGRPWIAFTEAHWSELEKRIMHLPRTALAVWAEQIGVDAAGLQREWARLEEPGCDALAALARDVRWKPREIEFVRAVALPADTEEP